MKTRIAVNAASGKMGQQVIGHSTTHPKAVLSAAFCRPNHRLLGRQVGFKNVLYSSDFEAGLAKSDVVIDFSLPAATENLLKFALAAKKPVLIGTTGFTPQQIDTIKLAALKIPVLLTPNTSIGVNSMMILLTEAAKMLGRNADIEIIETHHKHKVDAPSGTALRMGQAISETLGQDFDTIKATDSRFEKRSRKSGEIGISSVRAGEIVGEHQVLFALDNETISIKHTAHNRHCFAEGAVAAAIWLARQTAGFYSMEDFVSGR